MSFENPQNAKPLSPEEQQEQEAEKGYEERLEKAKEGMRKGLDAKDRKNMLGYMAEKRLDKSYNEQKTVNDVEISVKWDDLYNGYFLYFPQIELDKQESGKTKIIMIGQDKEKAKDAFNFVSEWAKLDETMGETSDVYKLYKKAERFGMKR